LRFSWALKRTSVFALAVVFAGPLFGQLWQVTLTSGRVYYTVSLDRLDGETLFLFHYPNLAAIPASKPTPVDNIVRIEPYVDKLKGINQGALAGGAIGLYVGGMLGYGFTHDDPITPSKVRTDFAITLGSIAIFATLGYLSGLDASLHTRYQGPLLSSNPSYRAFDLSNMDTGEKVRTLREIMSAFKRPWRM